MDGYPNHEIQMCEGGVQHNGQCHLSAAAMMVIGIIVCFIHIYSIDQFQ